MYNKLVRDRIPEIIEKDGKKPVISRIRDKKTLKEMLVSKLKEEVEEYCLSLELTELADILEVIRALVHNIHNIKFSDVEKLREEKERERGGFNEGIILEKVVDD
ncbi:phosphoribosyl-ATP pyrophosphohydrolase [Calderihabitans maritimus]|uniref:phosphoribosyl-ATP pyrophosphohydrolase n=1 Tax=Calderihabitans maritimus TaxID=1246530 RepID=UPI0034D2C315